MIREGATLVRDIDDIIRWCDEPVSTVLVVILKLELAGHIADAGTSD